MALSLRQFTRELHNEHIEEASFLYEFVAGSRSDPEFPWTAAADFERRREAHVDALLVGGEAALERCALALGDDPGTLYVCAAVALRSPNPRLAVERLSSWLVSSDPADDADADEAAAQAATLVERILPLRDALTEHASETTLAALAEWATARTPLPLLLGVALAVARRNPGRAPAALRTTLEARARDADLGDADERILFALLPGQMFQDRHLEALGATSETLRHAAIEHVYRSGGAPERGRLRNLARPGAGNFAALVNGADASFGTVLREAARAGLDEDLLLALGLHGTPECVAPILPALDSEHAETAAVALHAITGALLEEEAFEEEAIDETMLFEEELAAWRAGEAPTRADGSPWGETRAVLSTDPARWRAWLDEHASAFARGTRYRQGRPISPEALLFALRREHTPHAVRRHSAMELRVRHGLGDTFDISLPVAEQIRQLSRTRSMLGGGDVPPGTPRG